jgi:Cu(I)/Ag(I) efflux system membrane fusion protein/cobalt-zinc-cadmium efflux system membrane fusion protein
MGVLLGLSAGLLWNESLRHAIGLGGHDHANEATQTSGGQKQLWTCGMHPQVIQDKPGLCPICHMDLEPMNPAQAGAGASTVAKERKIRYWHDPMMNPPYITSKPGKSPMGMDLLPVYEDEISAGPTVQIDPVVVQNMGVRVATVSEGPLHTTIRAVGYLDEPETNRQDINLRVSGWIEKLNANVSGAPVKKGEPLFELYSPEVQVAIEEMISARRVGGSLQSSDATTRRTTGTLVDAARRKLELWGFSADQIESFAQQERAPATVAILSPITGHVAEKMVDKGAAVKAGDVVMRLVDRSAMWLDVQVFERQLQLIKVGQRAKATVTGVPGETLDAEVTFIHPHVDAMTRTATVRLVLRNENHVLRKGMYGTVQIDAKIADRAVTVLREAIIDTGVRQIAFVPLGGGHFEPRRLKTGLSSTDGSVQVLEGLAPGEQVVTSGQFLIDSESRLKEAIQKHLSQKLLKDEPAATAVVQRDPHAAHAAGIQPKAVETKPVPATQPAGVSARPSTLVDAVVAAYLPLAETLGKPQQASDPALDVAPLIEAARRLAEGGNASAQKLHAAASAMSGKPLPEQRKLFGSVSNAVIGLTQQTPPSTSVADKLFVMYCSMAPGSWLQATEQLANPYYATSMKQCGEVKGTIDAVGVTEK